MLTRQAGFSCLYKLVDCLVELFQRVVAAVYTGDAVLDVILEDDLRRAVERRAYRRKLHQHLGTVAPVLHHALDGLQMPDSAGQAVDHRLGLGVVVVVGVLPLVGVGVLVAVGMLRLQLMGVDMAVAMVVIIDLLFVFHGARFLLCSIKQYTTRNRIAEPLWGDVISPPP